MQDQPDNAIHLTTRAEWRAWLEQHHARPEGVWLISSKKATGKPRVAYEEAVEEALCFGWIDSIGRRIDDERHQVRFTPRRKGSVWSAVNIARVEALEAEGRMRDPGRAAFARRDDERSRIYSHERADARLDAAMEQRFREDARAWSFWTAQVCG